MILASPYSQGSDFATSVPVADVPLRQVDRPGFRLAYSSGNPVLPLKRLLNLPVLFEKWPADWG